MATQIVIVLCEGPHDVSFISKILKANEFVSNESLKINQFPPPMGGLMVQEIVKTDVEELNLQEIRKGFLPIHTLQKGDNWIFLYSMGGDGKKVPRQNIVQRLFLSVRQEGEIRKERIPDTTQISVLYFFDADVKGLAARLGEVNAELREVMRGLGNDLIVANAAYSLHQGIKFGCCIFTGSDNATGKLEDILVPLMKNGNEKIFDNAQGYLVSHLDDSRLFPLKWSITAGITTEKRSTKAGDKYRFDEKKSLLGVVGQLQKSGKSNTTCITDTDFLTLDKIRGDAKCKEVVEFINNVLNNN